MKFVLEYHVGGKDETIEVAVSDALIAHAQAMGHDLITVENLVHRAVDRFVRSIQPVSFWDESEETK